MFLGIDFAEKSVAVLLSNEAGQTQVALRAELPRSGGAAAQWLAAMDVARQAMVQNHTVATQLQSVCVAFFGAMDSSGVVMKDSRAPGWNTYDLPRALREHLQLSAEAFATAVPRALAEAIAEERLGMLRPNDGQPVADWLYVHLGITVEGAARCHSALVRGGNASAVELGALCIERGGVLSDSGRLGSLDAYCGGEAFMTRARSYSLTMSTAAEIWDMSASNALAKSLCDDYIERLAQGLGIALAMLNPTRLVLGGELSHQLGARLTTPLSARLGEYCLARHVEKLSMSTGQLGGDAAVLGAASLARDGLQ